MAGTRFRARGRLVALSVRIDATIRTVCAGLKELIPCSCPVPPSRLVSASGSAARRPNQAPINPTLGGAGRGLRLQYQRSASSAWTRVAGEIKEPVGDAARGH